MDAAVAEVSARIDALPGTRRLWLWVAIIAAGGFFEIYDLSLTAPVSVGLVAAHIFHAGRGGLFGLADQATFIFVTFLGLYLGVVAFAALGDRFGRRAVFAYSLVWYAIATLVMGFQSDAWSVCFWRFVAGIGVGAEAVAIDCFVVEIVPARLRGRAFCASMCIQYCAGPVSALSAALLIPQSPFGIYGWRWLTILPVVGASVFWVLRRRIPESPRWLASRGRLEEAHRALDALAASATGRASTTTSKSVVVSRPEPSIMVDATRTYVLRATIMMIAFFCLQNVAYFGFGNWTPTLLMARGVPLKQSLFYTAGVSVAAPLAPLVLMWISDRFERKYLIVASGLASVGLGLAFGYSRVPLAWVSFGIGHAISNSILAVNSHNYMSELFPTRIRARLVGFVYSFTRLAAAVSGYIVAYILANGGVTAVFVAISIFMFAATLIVLIAGPRTRNRSVEGLPTGAVLAE
ncbi:MAG: MFS transporter [Caulobacteraceae bacterium]